LANAALEPTTVDLDAAQASDDQGEPAPEPEIAYSDIIDSVLEGDVDNFKDQFNQAVDSKVNQALSQFQYQQQVREITNAFAAQFPEIVANDRLYQMTNERIRQMQTQGVDLAKAALEAGQETMQLVNDLRGGSQPGPEPTPQVASPAADAAAGRLERKRQTVVDFPQASAKHQRPAAPKELSKSDVLAQMRMKRGQIV